MGNPLLINAAELLRRPGSERRLALRPTIAELGIDDARLDPGSEAGVELHLESLTDGIVVDGEVTARWHDLCRRCLQPVEGIVVGQVHELYQQVRTDPDAFDIVGEQLDLVPMVREVILLDVPPAPLCREDCAGLCPVCGTDRNVTPCACATESTDPRWAALAQLRLTSDDASGSSPQ